MAHKFIEMMQKVHLECTFEKLSATRARELLQQWGAKHTEMSGGGMWWGSRFKTEDDNFFVYNRADSAWMGPFKGIVDAFADDHVVEHVAIVGREINHRTVAQTCLEQVTKEFWRFNARKLLVADLSSPDKAPEGYGLVKSIEDFNRRFKKRLTSAQFSAISGQAKKPPEWTKSALATVKDYLATEHGRAQDR